MNADELLQAVAAVAGQRVVDDHMFTVTWPSSDRYATFRLQLLAAPAARVLQRRPETEFPQRHSVENGRTRVLP